MEYDLKRLTNYQFLRHLKTPTISKCTFIAKNLTWESPQDNVVIKCFNKSKRMYFTKKEKETYVATEYYILEALKDHPFVPKSLDYFTTNSYAYVVMENMILKWKDLNEYTQGTISEDDFRQIIVDIIKALTEMSSLNLHYLDIKPSNVMINVKSKEIKLIDFESVFFEPKETSKKLVGSMGYISPECLKMENFNIKASQVFSLGCFMYTCIEKCETYLHIEEIEKNLKRKFRICSDNLRNLIEQCIKCDVNDRMKFEDLLKHKWFGKNQ